MAILDLFRRVACYALVYVYGVVTITVVFVEYSLWRDVESIEERNHERAMQVGRLCAKIWGEKCTDEELEEAIFG